MNDEDILNGIINKDSDFTDLIKNDDVAIIDRGFRNIVKKLNEYGLIEKIPACIPPEQKQLTTFQANHTRLVTKCRWVIEAINGILKRSFKALQSVPNTMLKHIITDYKIAAALINAFRPRLTSDGLDAELIAKNMLKKINTSNLMVKYLDKHNIKRDFLEIDSTDLIDFPRLELKTIINYITYGSYQISQGETYLSEHSNRNNGKLIIKLNLTSDEDDFKVIHVEFQSRHSNRTKHKIFIKYVPNSNEYDSIKGWVCSCKVGLRTVGCCSHIAGVIYYLSYLKPSNLPLPSIGKTLNNFLVNVEDTNDEADVQTFDSNKEISSNKINKKDMLIHNQIPSNDLNDLSSSIKRSCSITFETQTSKSQKTLSQTFNLSQISSKSNHNTFRFRYFSSHIPDWGGKIRSQSDDSKKYNDLNIINTCSIDYFLLSIWCCSKLNSIIKLKIDSKQDDVYSNISKIIELIDKYHWNEAKTIWLLDVINLKPNRSLEFNTYGSEYDFFIKAISKKQTIAYKCETCDIEVAKRYEDLFIYKSKNNETFFNFDAYNNCYECNTNVIAKFVDCPFGLFIQANGKIDISEIPLTIKIDAYSFDFLCCTFKINSNHFSSIFKLNNSYYLVDDLDYNKSLNKNIPDHSICTIFYYLT